MACQDCLSPDAFKRDTWDPCECCGRVDNDWGPKWVKYCKFCKAYICESCWNDWPKRAKAFGDKCLEKLKNLIP